MNEKISVRLIRVGEDFAYDVQITDEQATVADYIQALDEFLEAKVASCLGCDLCCRQRIPLTLPDIYLQGDEESQLSFLRDCTVIEKHGPVVDIRLRQDKDENCLFLDEEQARCVRWPQRSLVCHTYICLPQTARSRDLREHLINQGEDALVAYAAAHGLVETADYPPKPQWERPFDGIPLVEVVPPALFTALLAATAD